MMSPGYSAVSIVAVVCEVCCWQQCSYAMHVRGRALTLSHASYSDAYPLSGNVSLSLCFRMAPLSLRPLTAGHQKQVTRSNGWSSVVCL